MVVETNLLIKRYSNKMNDAWNRIFKINKAFLRETLVKSGRHYDPMTNTKHLYVKAPCRYINKGKSLTYTKQQLYEEGEGVKNS